MDEPSEKQRASWRNMDIMRTFLETCIQEVALNGRHRSSLKPDSWNKVKLALETTHGFKVSQKQMKNQYDYLKEKFQAWLPLTKKPGNIYDPATNNILMSHSEWKEYLKDHPKAKTLKSSPLVFPALCTSLFEGTTATGSHDQGPSCTTTERFEGTTATGSHDQGPSCTTTKPDVSSAIDVDKYGSDVAEGVLGDQNDEVVNSFQSQVGQKRKAPPSQVEIDEKMNAALKLLARKSNGHDAVECMRKLEMLEWEEPLYIAAASIFCEGDSYRKVWMEMTDVRKLQNWVKIVGRKLGYYDKGDL